jgi:hypothetical protein
MNRVQISIATVTAWLLLNTLIIQEDSIASKKTRQPAVNTNSITNKVTYLTAPFNQSTKILPNFLGHDLETISQVLNKRQQSSKKDEFETTQAFIQRVNTERNKPIIGTVNINSTLAFVSLNSFDSSYDADSNLFRIEIPKVDIVDSGLIEWKNRTFGHTTYEGSNAFGATVDIKSWNSESFSIKPNRSSSKQIITLKMSPSFAKEFKENFRVIFITKIDGYNAVETRRFSSKATFNSPYSVSYSDTYLNVEILEFKIFDKRSGQVYFTGNLYTPVDYTKLENLLQAQNFKEADKETDKVVLEVANRQGSGYLRKEDAEKFPCKELRSIDQLWLKYSGGKFGISVQQQIYQSLGGTKEYNEKVWESMGDRVGWRQGGQWLSYRDLNFSQTAPSGHLPYSDIKWKFRGTVVL